MAAWAPWTSTNTTVPFPLGRPSGVMPTSARMTSPAPRIRSFRSCHDACGGMLLTKTLRFVEPPPNVGASPSAIPIRPGIGGAPKRACSSRSCHC